MIGKQEAFQRYALQTDWRMVLEYRQRCEDLANRISHLISLMERYGFEDGNVGALETTALDQETSRLTERCLAVESVVASPETINEFLQALAQITEDIIATQERNCEFNRLMAARETKDQYSSVLEILLTLQEPQGECSPWTVGYLQKVYTRILQVIAPAWRKRQPGTILPASTYRQLRRVLWDVSDDLQPPTHLPELMQSARKRVGSGKAGPIKDYATQELLTWAFCAEIESADLARMLVEADLDRNREGTKAARIRREKKRLNQNPKNTAKKTQHEIPVGIKSP